MAYSFRTEIEENELRHRNNIDNLNAEDESEIILNSEVEVTSYFKDFLWNLLITILITAIILLLIRRFILM
jgi:hypothetical protein